MLKVKISPNASGMKSNPIYIANGIIVNAIEVNPYDVSNYEIFLCPESFNRFKHIGAQAAIVIDTKQVFEITTPNEIKKYKKISGNVIFGLDGILLLDPNLKISLKAINEIEIANAIDPINPDILKPCINIWTISKKNRKKYFTDKIR